MNKELSFVRYAVLAALLVNSSTSVLHAQNRRPTNPTTTTTPAPATTSTPAPASTVPKVGIKPYKEIITDKAKTDKGLFKVHRLDGKYFYEIPDSLFDREMLVVTRYAKTSISRSKSESGIS